MVMFESESDLLRTIECHDVLVRECVEGRIGFSEFCVKYDAFYYSWALDGHESDDEEQLLLEKHEAPIKPHRIIAHEILGKLCSDSDAELDSYIKAGRFGSSEALLRLAHVQFRA